MILPIIIMIGDYFYLRQRIPIFIYLFYTQFKEVKDPGIEKIIDVTVTIIAIIFSYTFTGLMRGVPFSSLIPFDWNYAGLLTWGLFFLIYYYMSQHSHLNKLTSFTFSTLSVVGGGWLYEIPFFHPMKMFVSYNTIFYLNGQIFCLLFLAYELIKIGFKMNKMIYAKLSLYLVFSGVLFFDWLCFARAINAIYPGLYLWIYRIPTCLFLLSLLGGIEKIE